MRIWLAEHTYTHQTVASDTFPASTFARASSPPLKGRMTIIAVTHRPALKRLADRALSLSAPRA